MTALGELLKTRDQTKPEGKWEFGADVADCFDDMLERSIPQYETMREAVTDLGAQFLPETDSRAMMDLGCSIGGSIQTLMDKCGDRHQYIGLEVSAPMLEACRNRFKTSIKRGNVEILRWDITEGLPEAYCHLIQSILTLQFTPIENRLNILQSVYNRLSSGGAFIIVEKVLGDSAELNELLIDEYYDMKRANGYTQDEIERKRLSLRGVLVPVTAEWNVELLKKTGFTQVDCFWRWMNFAGWIAIK